MRGPAPDRPPWWNTAPPAPGGPRRRRWIVVLASCLALLGGAAAAAYFAVLQPEGDVMNPDVEFAATEEEPVIEVERRRVDWPTYGFDRERTRHFPATGELGPPMRRLWSFRGSMLIEFAPIVVDDTLYLVRNSGGIHALDAETGETKWRRQFGELSASSPTYANGRLYVVNLEPGEVKAIRASDGAVEWRRSLPGRSESTPIVAGGRVFFGVENGELWAVDQRDGSIVWRTRLAGEVKAAPALSGETLYVGDYGGKMWAIRARDGSVRWSQDALGAGLGRVGNFYATPAVAYGRVYVGNTDGRVYSFSAEDGSIAWTVSTGDFVYAAPAVANTRRGRPTVYIGSYDGNFYALDARTGNERWRHSPGGKISGAASVVGEVVWYSDLDNRTTYGLSAATGNVVYRIRRGGFNPVTTDGERIYLTGYSQVYAFVPEAVERRYAREREHARRRARQG